VLAVPELLLLLLELLLLELEVGELLLVLFAPEGGEEEAICVPEVAFRLPTVLRFRVVYLRGDAHSTRYARVALTREQEQEITRRNDKTRHERETGDQAVLSHLRRYSVRPCRRRSATIRSTL
jgi:hypothetical protein